MGGTTRRAARTPTSAPGSRCRTSPSPATSSRFSPRGATRPSTRARTAAPSPADGSERGGRRTRRRRPPARGREMIRLTPGDTISPTRYDELRSSHRWHVPPSYNIAADVCDKHPRDKQAMIWESFDGSLRELDWGELQDLANQAAHTL